MKFAKQTRVKTFTFAALGFLVLFSVAAKAQNIHDAAEVEQKVRAIFADAPVMIEVARCESKFRQFTDAGNVYYCGYMNGMVGIFQIYASVHMNEARALGYDIETVDGNIGYARYLYNTKKTDPWISSFPCWNNSATTPPSESAVVTLRSDLSFGMVTEEVRVLQKLLNEKGSRVADIGPGSPGNETNIFGNLTRAAVRNFQCAKNIACSGDEHATGYGFVNSTTRTALLGSVAQPASNTPAGPATAEAEQIAALKAKIAILMKQVEELQHQLALAMAR